MQDLKECIKRWKERDLREIVPLYLAKTEKRNIYHCPFHKDSGPSLAVYDNHFHCYGCGAHGDVLDFAAKYWNTKNVFESLERLGDVTTIPISRAFVQKPRPKSADAKRVWGIAQQSIKAASNRALVNAYLDSRALKTDFVHGHYRRRTAGGCVVNYIVIPTFFNGELLSTQLRAMDSVTYPKYIRYGQSIGYNENNAVTSALTLPYLILSAENKAFDVLSVMPFYQAVMGAPSKYLLPAFAKRIEAYGLKQIVIVGDNDKKPQSKQRVMDIVDVLKPLGFSGKIVYPPDPYKDLNDMAQAAQLETFIGAMVRKGDHADG